MPHARPLALIALLAALAGPAGAQAPGLPAPREAEIVLSSGHAAGGYDRHEIHASDRIVIGHMAPGASMEDRRTDRLPGAHARAAAFLASEGVRIVARDGRAQTPCPGAVGVIEAIPPVGGFGRFRTGCPGGAEADEALFHGTVAAMTLD